MYIGELVKARCIEGSNWVFSYCIMYEFVKGTMCKQCELAAYVMNNVPRQNQTPHSGYVTLCYFNHCLHKNHMTMLYHVIDSKLQPFNYNIYYTYGALTKVRIVTNSHEQSQIVAYSSSILSPVL